MKSKLPAAELQAGRSIPVRKVKRQQNPENFKNLTVPGRNRALTCNSPWPKSHSMIQLPHKFSKYIRIFNPHTIYFKCIFFGAEFAEDNVDTNCRPVSESRRQSSGPHVRSFLTLSRYQFERVPNRISSI